MPYKYQIYIRAFLLFTFILKFSDYSIKNQKESGMQQVVL